MSSLADEQSQRDAEALGRFSWGVPVIVALNLFAFLVLAAQTSRNLWQLDFEADVDGNRAPQAPRAP